MELTTTEGESTAVAPVRKQVYDTICEAIFDLEIRPGERLVERELIDLTRVSRTSVREALRELEADGLLQRTPYRRLIVAVPTIAEVTEIFEIRGMMLGLMVRRFIENATDGEVSTVRDAYAACRAAADAKASRAAKDHLYDLLSSHTPIAHSVMSGLSARIGFFRALCWREPGRQEGWSEEFGRIIEAISRRDVSAADKACVQHIEGAIRVVLRVLEKYPWFHKAA